MASKQLIEDLKLHEGFVPHAYQDHLGFWTIGYGRLIDKRRGGGISLAEGEYLLLNDISDKEMALLHALPWVSGLDEVRLDVVKNMAFNLGIEGLLKFVQFLTALKNKDYTRASMEMLNSKWAKQVGSRAVELAERMKTGRI